MHRQKSHPKAISAPPPLHKKSVIICTACYWLRGSESTQLTSLFHHRSYHVCQTQRPLQVYSQELLMTYGDDQKGTT